MELWIHHTYHPTAKQTIKLDQMAHPTQELKTILKLKIF
jgi:hypothetical protein